MTPILNSMYLELANVVTVETPRERLLQKQVDMLRNAGKEVLELLDRNGHSRIGQPTPSNMAMRTLHEALEATK